MTKWRRGLVLLLVLIFGATIIGRLVYVQIINHDYWRALAQGQQRFFVQTQGERGNIFLKNGEPLAINKNWFLVFSSPIEIEDKEETAKALSEILDLDKNFVLEKIAKSNLYELIKKRLTDEEIEALEEANLKGIYLGSEQGRYYPFEFLASQTIGFLGGNNQGQYGIEGYYDEVLQGKDIFFEKERKPGGYLTRNITGSDQKGSDLFLTIDYNIQFQAEKLLEEAEKNLGAEGGEIIVIDPTNGKIIALASLPGFNPNQYFEVKNLEVFKNPVVQKIFEPGSAFKPITMAIALDLGKIKPQTTYNDPGIMHVDGWPIRNYAHRVYPGDITMTEVLEKSINTGAVFAVNQVENSDFLEYLERFGLFEKTEIDLKGEIAPSNRELKQGRDINFATASYGQGIEMTPLQLVRAFSAVANNGKLVRPYLVEKIIKNDGVFETEHQVSSDNVISHSTAVKLTTMLVSVVEEGFSKAARIPGYYVAGKTGTAQVSFAALGIDKKGYSEKTWQSFVGYAPAFNPQFLILVKLNNPGTRTAEYSAVPVFRELAKYIIDYWQIPPDY